MPIRWRPWFAVRYFSSPGTRIQEKQDHTGGDLRAASLGRAPGRELLSPEQLNWAG